MSEQASSVKGPRGLVLAGGAALGAYEVGVVHYLANEVAHELGRPLQFELFTGTSAGAINTAVLAAFADDLRSGVHRLSELWCSLRLGAVLRPSGAEILSMLFEATTQAHWVGKVLHARGGVLDPGPIEELVRSTPMERIDQHVRSGRVQSVALSATRVSTGRAVVFHDSHAPRPDVGAGSSSTMMATHLRPPHALASAAIPLLFPAVAVEGEPYCDGGLRQVVPLSPAIRLGARRLLVVNPTSEPADISPEVAAERRAAVVSPIFLAGKALGALFLDRMEVDLDRAAQTNHILAAGRRRWGPSFDEELGRELVAGGGHPVSELGTLCIQPSCDLGALATEYAQRELGRHEASVASLLLRRLAQAGATRAGDVLSYLMFDGGFTRRLIELGRSDARAHHGALCALLAD